MIIPEPQLWEDCRVRHIVATRKLPVDRNAAPTAQKARRDTHGRLTAFWSAKALVVPERSVGDAG